jgi:putative transposase
MKKSKFTEEQIAYALRQVESGTPPADVCRQLGVSEPRARVDGADLKQRL